MKRLVLFLAAALAAFLIVLPVTAAKPVPSGTIAIAAGSDLTLGGIVSFDVTVSELPNWANPRIQVMCSQGGVLVYGEAHNITATILPAPWDGPSFQLGGGSSQWLLNGGAADCEATLYYWGQVHGPQPFFPLASVTFGAGG